jgi:hypothetical protein
VDRIMAVQTLQDVRDTVKDDQRDRCPERRRMFAVQADRKKCRECSGGSLLSSIQGSLLRKLGQSRQRRCRRHSTSFPDYSQTNSFLEPIDEALSAVVMWIPL